MLSKKLAISLTILSLALYSCGGQISPIAPIIQPSSPSVNVDNDLTEIKNKLDSIEGKLDKLKPQVLTSSKPSSTKPSAKPVVSTEKNNTEPNNAISKEPTPKAVDSSNSSKTKGRKIMDLIISKINKSTVIEAEVDKYERFLKDGSSSTFNLKLISRKSDSLVKIDVVNASNPSNVGIKLRYTSGDRSGKVKVRPSGALSLVTTELAKSDDRIVSFNGYLLDDTDFFGMAKRFAEPEYEAEVSGISKMEGTEIYILKITNKNQNSLDSQIKYEHIGFDPKTYAIRLWEAFDGKSKDAFYRLQLKTLNFLDSVPDNKFNV